MPSSLKDRWQQMPLFWRLQLVGWSAYFVYGCLSRTGFYNHLAMGVGMSLLLEPTGFLLSTGLRFAYRRLGLTGFSARTLGIILAGSLAATLLQLVVAFYGAPWVAQLANYHARPSSLLTRITFFLFIYLTWSAAYVWLKTEFAARTQRAQLAEANAAAQRAELHMLRLQLNPHFLFNSLNSIATQIPAQPEAALEMTHDLADFLRSALDRRLGLLVPLAQEVEVMTAYLKIEQLRFGAQLTCQIEVDPAAQGVEVPCFLLQPLAENAVKHGLASAPPPWALSVHIARTGAGLRIEVRNPGQLAPDWATKPDLGLGVSNLRRRLELHYPARHRFALRQDGAAVCAELTLEGEPCPV